MEVYGSFRGSQENLELMSSSALAVRSEQCGQYCVVPRMPEVFTIYAPLRRFRYFSSHLGIQRTLERNSQI